MVAKIDKEEALSSWTFRSRLILILMGVLLVLASAGFVGVLLGESARQFQMLYRAESGRRIAESKQNVTLMSIGDGVIVTNAAGEVDLMNPVAEALTGVRLADAQGKPLQQVFRLLNEDTREPVENPVQIVLNRGVVVGLANHSVLVAQNGSEYPIADSCAPIRGETGAIIGTVLVFHDQTEERKREAARKESEERYRTLFENSINGVALHRMEFDEKGKPCDYVFLSVNAAFERLTGLKGSEIIGKRISEVMPGLEKESFLQTYGEVASTGRPAEFNQLAKSLGRRYHIFAFQTQPGHFATVSQDITEAKLAEEERETTIGLLRLLNGSNNLRELIHSVLEFMQNWSGCEAVGVRLKEGEDYPYYEYRGFSKEFIEAERTLCLTDREGFLVRNETGQAVLECMCGNVLRGRTDASKPFFTEHGSFWSNNTTKLLATTTDADRQTRTRNRCNREGYESVALIPLRSGDDTFGLLQMNDRRIGMFSPTLIALAERLGDSLAIGLAQRKAAESLRESEERFRAIATHTPDHILMQDAELRYRFVVNPQLGLTEAEMIGKRDADFLAREDAEKLTAIKKQVLATGEPFQVEVPLQNKKGEWEIFSGAYMPIRSASGDVTGLIGYFQNVTARRQAEEALRESEAMLQRAQQIAQVGHFRYQVQNDRIDGSNELYRIFRLPPENVSMTAFAERVKESDRERLNSAFQEAVREGKDYDIECQLILPEGGEACIRMIGEPVLDASGRTCQLIGTVQDLSERKKAEDAIRESETRLSAFMDAAGDSFYLLDSRLTLLEINTRGLEIIDRKKEDVIGKNIADIAPEVKNSGLYAKYLEVIRTGKAFMVEDFVPHPKFGDKHFALTAFRVGDGLGIIAHDITERVNAEENLRASEERYRHITASITDYIYTVRVQDSRAVETVHGAACEAVTGYSAEELRVNPGLWLAMVHPEDREAVSRQAAQILREGKSDPLEHRILRKDGTVRWVRSVHVPHTDSYGELFFYDGLLSDITERKQAEEALRKTEERFSAAFNLSHVIMAITEVETGRFVEVNDAFCEKFQFSKARVIGKTAAELGIFLDASAREAYLRPVREKGFARDVEVVFRSPSGKRGIGLFTANKVEVGGNTYLLTTMIDITERKRAENALQESEEKYRVLVQNIRDYVFSLSPDGTFRFVNDAYAGFLRKKPEEIVGKTIQEIFPPESARNRMEFLRKVVESGERGFAELMPTTPEGETRYSSSTLDPIRDENGKISWLLGIARDVTEQKKAESALRESEERFRAIIANTEAGYFFIDKEGIIRDVNPAWVRLYKYDAAEEVLGHHFAEIQRIDDMDLAREAVDGILRGDPAYMSGEFTRKCKDGSIGFHSFSARPVVRAGEVIGIEGFAFDTTERKRTEEAVEQQLDELRRWHAVMLDREDRIRALKREVNALLSKAGERKRYSGE